MIITGGGNKIKYQYGTDDSYSTTEPTDISVDELTTMINSDVEKGKFNTYYGGETNSRTAKCKFNKRGYIYHNQLLIYGTEEEFKQLESNLTKIMTVIPRIFTS